MFTKMKILWIYCIIVKSLSIDFRERKTYIHKLGRDSGDAEPQGDVQDTRPMEMSNDDTLGMFSLPFPTLL